MRSYPFYSSNYGPLFPLLLAPLVKVFGPKLWVGRVFSFITTLVIGGTIFWIVRRETRQRTIAILVALAFFAANIVYQIGPLFRLHMTMVMFGLLGIVFMARLEDQQHGKRYLWLGLVFLFLAGYTKQLAFDAVAAGFGFFFLRRPKQAVVYGIGFLAVVVAFFLALNVVSKGQWFFNAITANANPFIPGQTQALFQQWFQLYSVGIVLAFGYVLWTLYIDRISIYSLYFVAATAKGALSGKWGAGPGYFVTSIVAALICAGIGLGLLTTLGEGPCSSRAPGSPVDRQMALEQSGARRCHSYPFPLPSQAEFPLAVGPSIHSSCGQAAQHSRRGPKPISPGVFRYNGLYAVGPFAQ